MTKPDPQDFVHNSLLSSESLAYQKSSKVILYLILPTIALISAYYFSLGDYLVALSLVGFVVFNLAVIFVARLRSLATYETRIYYYAFNLWVALLGLYFLYLIGVENRYEFLPWSLTFIFPAFLIFPRVVKIPAVVVFLAALAFIISQVRADLVITGHDLLIRFVPSFFFVSILFYIHSISVDKFRSELARSREALDLSRKRYKIVSELASDVSFALTVDDRGESSLEWSLGAMERLSEYGNEELAARGGWPSLVHLEDQKKGEEHYRELLAGHAHTISYRIITKSGTVRWVEAYSRPEWDEGKGRVTRIFGAIKDVTEKVEAQNELRVTREDHLRLINDAVVGVFTADTKGHFLSANLAMARMYGYDSPEEFMDSANNISDQLWLNLQDRSSLLDQLDRYGRVDGLEIQRRTKTGQVFWASLDAKAIRDARGNLIGMEGFSQDITARKNAEDTLKTLTGSTVGLTGQEFFDNAVQNICRWLECEIGLISEMDQRGRFRTLAVFLDGGTAPGFEYASEGAPCWKAAEEGFFHQPDNIAVSFPRDRRLAKFGARSYVGIRIPDARGDTLGVLCAMSRRPLDLPKGARDVLTIISERARAEIERGRYEKELDRQRIRLEELIEAAPEAIVVVDGHDMIERVNTEFTRLFGYTPEEAVGSHINDLLSFPDVHEETARNKEIITSGGTIKEETVRRRKDGTTVQVSFLGTRIKSNEGLDRIYLIYRDITARKQAEQAQRESHQALVTISDSIDADIHVTDLETRQILFMNKHMRDTLGGSLEGEFCYRALMNRDEPCDDCNNRRLLGRDGNPAGLIVWEGINPTTDRFHINYDRAIKWMDGRYARLRVSTDATERKAIEEDLTRRVAEMAALNSLGRRVNSSLSLEETVRASLSEIKNAAGSSLALLFLRKGGVMELAGADFGDTQWEGKVSLPTNSEECLCGLAEGQGKPVYSNDIATDPRYTHTQCRDAGIRSFTALPLVAGTEIMGVLGLGHREKVDFTQRAEFLETAATEIAAGLHNAKLFEQLQDGAARMEETIRDLEAAQQELKDSESKFASFTDSLPALAYMKEVSGKYLFVNNAFKTILGLDPGDLIGRYDNEFFPRESVEGFKKTAGQALEYGKIMETVRTVEDTEGNTHSFLNLVFPIRRSGKDGVIGAISLDITEKLSAEEAAKKSESVAQVLFELIPDAILRFKRDGTITFWKGTAGTAPDPDSDPVGKNSRDYISPQVLAERETLIKGVLERGEVATHEYTMELEGRIFNVEARYVRYDKDEVMAILRDTTERKHLEAQLAQSQRMEAIGVLASGITHDFNNILQAVSGHTQLLLVDRDLKGPQKSKIARIDQTLQRAAEVVRRLLTFSRKGEIRFTPLDLNREVEHTVELLRHSLPKMISIEADLEPELRAVGADPSQIEQVLMNLGANARDAMPDGGRLIFRTGSVTLGHTRRSAFPELPRGDYVRLEVIDDGQGMEPKVAARIFEPFYTTKEVGRGTGLGLFTVYGIIRGHKGHIACESRPGQGTAFTIMLPALEEKAAALPGPYIPSEDLEPGVEGRGTILLVDDEKHIRETGREFLANRGYEVLMAQDGETALEIYGRQWREIDVVILDLGMPGMGGEKALAGLLDINPRAKVLIASGYSVGHQDVAVMEQGAAGFIGKPYRLSKLLKKIKELIA